MNINVKNDQKDILGRHTYISCKQSLKNDTNMKEFSNQVTRLTPLYEWSRTVILVIAQESQQYSGHRGRVRYYACA